jgi:hypothetical protein
MVGAGIELRARRLGDLIRRAVRYHRKRQQMGRSSSNCDVERWLTAAGRDPRAHCCSRRVASVSVAERETPGGDEAQKSRVRDAGLSLRLRSGSTRCVGQLGHRL